MDKILIVVALICFVVAAVGIPLGPIQLVPLGLAFMAASKLV